MFPSRVMSYCVNDDSGKHEMMNESEKESLWEQKIKEIMEHCDEILRENDRTKLTKIYEKYRNMFLEQVVTNFQCYLQIKENVAFNKVISYTPINKSHNKY